MATTVDHLWPTSRGAKSTWKANQAKINQYLHDARHTLFGNDLISEIITKLIVNWETVNPTIQKNAPHLNLRNKKFLKRKEAWLTMFGKRANQKKAIERVMDCFVRTQQDKELVKECLHLAVILGVINTREYDQWVGEYLQ